MTLMQRHDMFVQNAKSRENKEDENDKSSDTQNNSNSPKVKNTNLEAKFLARKVRKPLNRKPLYPGSKKKSSKTSTTKNTAESSPNISASKKLIAAGQQLNNHQITSEDGAPWNQDYARTWSRSLFCFCMFQQCRALGV